MMIIPVTIIGLIMLNDVVAVNSGSGTSTVSDMTSHQSNINNRLIQNQQQYSINQNGNNKIDDEQIITKTQNINTQLQMDEYDALKILLQNFKNNLDIQQRNQQTFYQPSWNQWTHNNDEFMRSGNSNRYFPGVTYIQAFIIPYPVLINSPQNSFIPSSSSTSSNNAESFEYDDAMARGNINRRGNDDNGGNNGATGGILASTIRNSPIYYVRLPPNPYDLLSSLRVLSAATPHLAQSQNFRSTYSPILLNSQIRSLPPNGASSYSHSGPSTASLNSILNVPVHFLANGKPTNIYHMDGSNDLSQLSGFNQQQTQSQHHQQQQQQQHQQIMQSSQIPTSSSFFKPFYQSQQQQQQPFNTNFMRQPVSLANLDSKITNLKRQYYFNGKPDDAIYLLPNDYDRWNSNYQNTISDFY